MRAHIGTSGFAYQAWIGPFYPQGTRDQDLLAWYATQFDAVEINNTFYRFPTTAGLAAWAARVPADFQFAFKAPQLITHRKRMRDVDTELSRLFDTLATLGPHLGPVLFQLPPRMPLNLDALRDLLIALPPTVRVAFEFRDLRWYCDSVYALLAEHRSALCFNDDLTPAPQPTADWGYLRLRRDHYADGDLHAAATQLRAQPWREAYLFVKHEAPDSPLLARRLAAILRAAPPAVP